MVIRSKDFRLTIPGSMPSVMQAYEHRIVHMDEFSELENEQIISLDQTETIITVKRFLSLELPEALLSWLPGTFRHLTEELHYYKEDNRQEISTFFENARDRFEVDCQSSFHAAENSEEVERVIHLRVKVDLPIIGTAVATTAIETFTSALTKDTQGLAALVKHGVAN